MFHKSRKKLLSPFFSFSFASLVAMASFILFSAVGQAAPFSESSKTGDNVTGHAWSENYGWVSFNSDNCDKNAPLGQVDNPALCAQPKDSLGNAVNLPQYGVNVNYVTGSTTGSAWSENAGWILFDSWAGADVRFDRNTGIFSGKAAVYVFASSTMDDLVFKGMTTVPSAFGVTVDVNESSPSYEKFSGWAWNGNGNLYTDAGRGIGLGWLSFNSDDAGASSSIPYSVTINLNKKPTAGSIELWRTQPLNPEQAVPLAGGSGVISLGDEASFRATWTDADSGDRGKVLFCKNSSLVSTSSVTSVSNATTTGIDSIACAGGAANTWCSASSTNTQGQVECLKNNFQTSDVGTNKKFYTTVCDQYGYCTGPTASDPFTINDQPFASASAATSTTGYSKGANVPVATAPPMATDPMGNVSTDHVLNFSARWSDQLTNSSIKMFVCRTSGFVRTHGSQGCQTAADEFCNVQVDPGAATSGNLSCQGQLRSGDETPAGTKTYYVTFCDGYGACSASSSNAQYFVNKRPTVASMSAPNWDPHQAAENDPNESDLKARLDWTIDDSTDTGGATGLSDGYLHVTGGGDDNWARNNVSALTNKFSSISVCSNSSCGVWLSDRGTTTMGQMLDWNTAYMWWVAVKDAYAWSDVRQFDTSVAGNTLTDDTSSFGNGMNASINTAKSGANAKYTFTTYKHNFPIVNESGILYFPTKPSANEEVKVTPNGRCYEDNRPRSNESGATVSSIAVPCDEASLDCVYDWKTNPAVAELKSTTTPVTWGNHLAFTDDVAYIRFKSESFDAAGNKLDNSYQLTVIDRDNYFNTNNSTKIDYVNEKLPSWREVK